MYNKWEEFLLLKSHCHEIFRKEVNFHKPSSIVFLY